MFLYKQLLAHSNLSSFGIVMRGASVFGFSVCSQFFVYPIYSKLQMSISQLLQELQGWNPDFFVMCSILKKKITIFFGQKTSLAY